METCKHFGDWMRQTLLNLDLFVSHFAAILDVQPGPIHDLCSARATVLLERDLCQLAHELGIPKATIRQKMEEAANAELQRRSRYPSVRWKRSSVFRKVKMCPPSQYGRIVGSSTD